MRDDVERLRDVEKAIHQILSKTADGPEIFFADEMLQVWVLHHLQIVGEACRWLTEGFRQRNPEKAWTEAAGMRHILVHHYFEIDVAQIWKVVEHDLPELLSIVERVLKSESELG
jgi:uncharacterized protein with HEPN domain